MESILKDRISSLPDDSLVSIVSCLKLQDATRTSVLSHRWRDLWTYSTGLLDFVKSGNNLAKSTKREFIEWVNLVLYQHKANTIDEFRVCFDLKKGDSDAINSWIKFALGRHVKRLVLDFAPINPSSPDANFVLERPILDDCRGSFTALHLNCVNVTGEVLACILSRLSSLRVLHVNTSLSLTELKVSGSLPNLRSLEIINCYCMSHIEVHASSLVSLAFVGPETSIFLGDLPRLIEAKFNRVFLSKKISCFASCFSRLESLVLDFRDSYFDSAIFRKLPSLEKLKWLELSFRNRSMYEYLYGCINLLKVSPLLHRFMLKIFDIKQESMLDCIARGKKVKYRHNSLKVLEFAGFLGGRKDTELVRRLLARLPSLEKVVVNPGPLRSQNFPTPEEWDSRKAAASARELQYLLPRGAKLVIAPSPSPIND